MGRGNGTLSKWDTRIKVIKGNRRIFKRTTERVYARRCKGWNYSDMVR